MHHLRPPVNINHLTLYHRWPFPLSHMSKTKFTRAFPGFPDHSTSIPLHRQPPRSANFSILIFQLLPPLWLQVCFFPGVQKWLWSPEWDDVIRLLYHGIALTLNWKPSGKGRCGRMERRRAKLSSTAFISPATSISISPQLPNLPLHKFLFSLQVWKDPLSTFWINLLNKKSPTSWSKRIITVSILT